MISFLVATSKASVGGAAVTTDAIDTTSADFLVIVVGCYGAGSDPSVSDSKSNSWTPLTKQLSGGDPSAVQIFYSVPTSVGSGHTFSDSAANFGTVCAAAFSGILQSSSFDDENGSGNTSVTSIQSGSISPSENNELIIAGNSIRGLAELGLVSINDSFTIATQKAGVSGNSISGALAYLIQTTAASANPTWSWTNSDNAAAVIASFKEVAGPPPAGYLLVAN